MGSLLPDRALPIPATLVLSNTDPWLSLHAGQRWAQRWGVPAISMGDAGHINIASGHATLPLARNWVLAQEQRLARMHQPAVASLPAWGFAR